MGKVIIGRDGYKTWSFTFGEIIGALFERICKEGDFPQGLESPDIDVVRVDGRVTSHRFEFRPIINHDESSQTTSLGLDAVGEWEQGMGEGHRLYIGVFNFEKNDKETLRKIGELSAMIVFHGKTVVKELLCADLPREKCEFFHVLGASAYTTHACELSCLSRKCDGDISKCFCPKTRERHLAAIAKRLARKTEKK